MLATLYLLSFLYFFFSLFFLLVTSLSQVSHKCLTHLSRIFHAYLTHSPPHPNSPLTMSSKRQSLMPAAPPTPVHFVTDRSSSGTDGQGHARSSHVVMADNVYVVGTYPVTISSDTVVHPRARLDAKNGPVNIGRRCIVEERAVVGGGGTSQSANMPTPEGSVTLGDYVSVETGAVLEAGAVVGQGSVVGARSQIGSGAIIGRVSSSSLFLFLLFFFLVSSFFLFLSSTVDTSQYCTLAPRTRILPGEKVPDFTVVYGQQRRRDGRTGAAEARHRQQARKIEVLRKLIPSVPEKYMVA